MARFTVAAIGSDRPGIVAGVSAALVDAGCNLEDSSMTILGGQFAILLLLSAPESSSVPQIEASLAEPAAEFGLTVGVSAVVDVGVEAEPEGEWTVSVHGADRPGIVHSVARLLADAGVNIVDLNTRRIGPDDDAVYAMTLDVTLPSGTDADTLAAQLRRLSGEIGVDTRLHRSQADIF